MTSSSFPRGNLTGWRPPPIACSSATPTARRRKPALLVAQQPSVPGDGDRPAVRRFDERPSDLEGIDAGAVVRADRPAAQFHDRQQIAIAGPAVQDLEGERNAVAVVLDRSRSEFVGEPAESGELHAVLHDGTASDAAGPPRGGDAGEKMPAVREVITDVQSQPSVDAAARLVAGP